jgi:hypothetical protein
MLRPPFMLKVSELSELHMIESARFPRQESSFDRVPNPMDLKNIPAFREARAPLGVAGISTALGDTL